MLSGRICHSWLGRTSGSIHRLAQSASTLYLLYHPFKGHAVQAPFLATSGVVAVIAVPTLGAAARAYELDAVAVTTGEGVHLLGGSPVVGDDGVALYSSHIAPIRNIVPAVAWIAFSPNPLLSVAGVMSSPPGADTHRNVARWFRGISSNSPPDV